jgi:shikimate kinase
MGSVIATPSRPRVIELIGPAGVGKSEVTAQLARMPGVLCTSIWHVPLSELAWATFCTIPSAATLIRRAGAPLSRELRHIARLRALLNFLDRDELSAYRYIVLDEGAIYTLSWLHVIGHSVFADFRSNAWRHYIAALWAAQLDEVIWLDAPDNILAHRLRTRAKRHVMSNASDRSVTAFSLRYRAAFNSTIGTVQRHGRLAVRDYRTDHHSPSEIAELIMGGGEPARLPELAHG